MSRWYFPTLRWETVAVNKWERYGTGLKNTMRFGSVGLEMGLSVGLSYLLGDWLDGKFDTAPWLMLVSVMLGTVAGFWNLYRVVVRAGRDGDK